MLVAAATAVITIDQEVYAFVRPIPTASVSTVAIAGIKTMILKRWASAAPTKKLSVESTSTLASHTSTGSAAGRLLPNTLILREGDSRYTTGIGIKIPILARKMTLATAFRQNSGADQYQDLGRLSRGRISLIGRFGRCVPKSARIVASTSYRTIDRWGPPWHIWRSRASAPECFAVVADTSLPVEVRIGLNPGHWP
jgi:hypothetical protein